MPAGGELQASCLPVACGTPPRPPPSLCALFRAADGEQQRNFEFFLRSGVEEQADWLSYRIILAEGPGVLVRWAVEGMWGGAARRAPKYGA